MWNNMCSKEEWLEQERTGQFLALPRFSLLWLHSCLLLLLLPTPSFCICISLYFAVFCRISLYFSPFNLIAFLRPHPTQRPPEAFKPSYTHLVGRPTQLIYISDIYLFRLFRYLDYLDDQHRNTNMNDKDHLVGQLTNTHQDLIRDSRARP